METFPVVSILGLLILVGLILAGIAGIVLIVVLLTNPKTRAAGAVLLAVFLLLGVFGVGGLLVLGLFVVRESAPPPIPIQAQPLGAVEWTDQVESGDVDPAPETAGAIDVPEPAQAELEPNTSELEPPPVELQEPSPKEPLPDEHSPPETSAP